MTWMALLTLLAAGTPGADEPKPVKPVLTLQVMDAPLDKQKPAQKVMVLQPLAADPSAPVPDCFHVEEPRRCLESDRAFPRFIGPISNPILSKDPRSTTEARALFVNNIIPPGHPFGGGNFQAVGLEVRVALTDRLTFLADKDGYLWLHPNR